MEVCVGGSPVGHSSKFFSRNFLPSFTSSLMSCLASGVAGSLGSALVLSLSVCPFVLLLAALVGSMLAYLAMS